MHKTCTHDAIDMNHTACGIVFGSNGLPHAFQSLFKMTVMQEFISGHFRDHAYMRSGGNWFPRGGTVTIERMSERVVIHESDEWRFVSEMFSRPEQQAYDPLTYAYVEPQTLHSCL